MFNFYSSIKANFTYQSLAFNLLNINSNNYLSTSYSDLIRQIESDDELFLMYENDLEEIKIFENNLNIEKDRFYYIFADINEEVFANQNCKIITSSTYFEYFDEIFKNRIFSFDNKKYAHELIRTFFKSIVCQSKLVFVKGPYFLDKFISLNDKNISIFKLIKDNNDDLYFISIYLGTDKDWQSKKSFQDKLSQMKKEFEMKFDKIDSRNKLFDTYLNNKFIDRVIITDKYYIKVTHLIDYVEKKLNANNNIESENYDDIAILPLLCQESLSSFKKLLR